MGSGVRDAVPLCLVRPGRPSTATEPLSSLENERDDMFATYVHLVSDACPDETKFSRQLVDR
jgi:hypothetical protein